MSEEQAHRSESRPDPQPPSTAGHAGPGGAPVGPPAPGYSVPQYYGVSPPAHRSGWTGGPVLALVLGVLIVLVGLGVTATGASLLGFSAVTRDDGYVTTPTWSADGPGHAVVTGEAELWGTGLDQGLGDVRVRAVALDGEELFVGITTAADARDYLADVRHTVLTGWGTRDVAGGAPTVPPTDADIWIASATGAVAEATTPARPGTWVAVVMPADGVAGVDAVLDVGATLPWLVPVGVVTTLMGLALLAGGATALVTATRAATAPARQPPAAPGVGSRQSPVVAP